MPPVADERPGQAALLRLEGEMTIYRAVELKAQVLAALDAAPSLEIDLSGVTEIDTAGVQLLLLAKRSAQQGARALRLSGHSPAVIDAFELFDLAATFGDPLLMPSPAAT